MADDVRIEPNRKWIRGVIDGVTVVDSRRTRFVWEHRYYPQWYVPVHDVRGEMRPNGSVVESSGRGAGERFDLVVGGRMIPDAGWRHADSSIEELRDLVRFEWDALDAWFEENVEVFVHPRSPEVRVDALPSSRHVRVSIDGELVADSTHPTVLFETGLPERYYLPKVDVRMDLLTPTERSSACPYKGWANYWSVTVGGVTHDDVAWGYRTPLPESEAIAGLVCFYNERVDLEIDGESVERPTSKFS